jgi:hypothetical protein
MARPHDRRRRPGEGWHDRRHRPGEGWRPDRGNQRPRPWKPAAPVRGNPDRGNDSPDRGNQRPPSVENFPPARKILDSPA